MKYSLRYGSGVLSLPKEILNLLDSTSGEDLRVLLVLAANTGEIEEKKLAADAGCSVARVRRAVSFLSDAGLLSCPDLTGSARQRPAGTAAEDSPAQAGKARPAPAKQEDSTEKPGNSSEHAAGQTAKSQDNPEKMTAADNPPAPDRPLRRAEELPDYTTAELASILEKRRDLAMLLEECQRAWGKVFNTHEANIVIGLIEYLGFDGEYILLLLSHCAKLNVRSLHSAERLAYRMHDEGTVTVDALREKLCRMEAAHGAEGMIRSMFGIGSRSLTDKEKTQIDLWINTYRFPEEILRRAYEITVNVKSKPSISYAGGILKRWHEAGLDTIEKIDRAETERQEKTAQNVMDAATLAEPGDSFWEAAVRASYGKDFSRLGLGAAQPESTAQQGSTEESSGAAQNKKGSSGR